jgi:hypothetical protein
MNDDPLSHWRGVATPDRHVQPARSLIGHPQAVEPSCAETGQTRAEPKGTDHLFVSPRQRVPPPRHGAKPTGTDGCGELAVVEPDVRSAEDSLHT